jgi:ubiquinone/menaquinone biosynthesis C-methylase UbiE
LRFYQALTNQIVSSLANRLIIVTKPSVSSSQQRLYDNYYDDASEWRWIGALAKADNINNLSLDLPHERILEIGAGDGAVLKRLSEIKFGNEYYALEISSSAVREITRRAIRGLVDCRVYDGSSLPYEDKQFDLVVLSHVIEHLEFPRQLIYEAGRVGSFVFVEVPLEDTIYLTRNYNNKIGHINFYSPWTIRYLLESCHLEVIKQIICNMSKKSFVFRSGKKSIIRNYMKELVLLAFPFLATRIWTYHSAIICRSPEINTKFGKSKHS